MASILLNVDAWHAGGMACSPAWPVDGARRQDKRQRSLGLCDARRAEGIYLFEADMDLFVTDVL
jgi:hypothetical protein